GNLSLHALLLDLCVFLTLPCLRWCCSDTFSCACREPCRTELSSPSLHDALPISGLRDRGGAGGRGGRRDRLPPPRGAALLPGGRSEEHTSELQSRFDLVCRLLLEKKIADAREYRKQ